MSDVKLPAITAEIYTAFRTAIEIGKWPDGRVLTQAQRETCMEAIISYDLAHNSEQERVGFIDRGHKAEGELCDDDTQILDINKKDMH